MKIIDDFLNIYHELKLLSNKGEFYDIENPIDGVRYPLILKDIPDHLRGAIIARLALLMDRQPENITMFMRRSPAGVHVPHIAHHDLSMGKYSLMLYLNDHDDGGTAFIRHKDTGMAYAPEHPDFVAIAQFDQNNTDKWAVIEQTKMKQNRAVIFDAGLFHCAMPIGGFGVGSEARTVLTVFFS